MSKFKIRKKGENNFTILSSYQSALLLAANSIFLYNFSSLILLLHADFDKCLLNTLVSLNIIAKYCLVSRLIGAVNLHVVIIISPGGSESLMKLFRRRDAREPLRAFTCNSQINDV